MADQEIPDKLLQLLRRAKLDVDGMPDTEAECSAALSDIYANIEEINAELALDLETGHRDNDWRIRATHAKRYRHNEYVAVKAWRLHLRTRRKRQVENMQGEIARLLDAHAQQKAKMHLAQQAQDVERRAYRQWIAENAPEHLAAADGRAVAAREAFRAAHAALREGDG
jgi:hypothetical protein